MHTSVPGSFLMIEGLQEMALHAPELWAQGHVELMRLTVLASLVLQAQVWLLI